MRNVSVGYILALLFIAMFVPPGLVSSSQAPNLELSTLRDKMIKRWAQLAAGYRPVYPKTFGEFEHEYFHAKIDSGVEADAISYAKEAKLEYVGRLGELKNRFVFRRKLDQKRSLILGKRNNSTDSEDTRDLDQHRAFAAAYDGVSHFDKVATNIPIFKRNTILKSHVQYPSVLPEQTHKTYQTKQKNHLSLQKPFEKRDWTDVVKIKDPLFNKQWHLLNTQTPGNDINVTGVWAEGINGQNVTVALIDDGLDYTSEDLFLSFDFEGSYDLNDNTKLPTPRLFDDFHGTRCAGQIAARINNVCGVGAAFGSKVSGIRMLSGSVDEITQVTAVNYKYQHNDIYSCSWGPNDDGATLMGPTEALNEAFINGVENGRGGKGSIFVFATGNGGRSNDNCNFDGYTNSIYTISIGAIDHDNRHPDYSEACSAQIAVTYSSSDTTKITTTDIGLNKCTSSHGGTSAAAPLAAGIIALALSVRPDLSWRDVQHLIVNTAIPIATQDSDWDTVANGRKFNHKFGFGKMDAYALVQAAKTFKNLGPQTRIEISTESNLKLEIPKKGTKGPHGDRVSSTLKITEDMVKKSDMKALEHITVTLNANHTMRGNMHIFIESPSGVKSELAPPRMGDVAPEGFEDWKFMSMKHWDGPITGDWKLTINNALDKDHTGTLTNWTLALFGESNAPGPKPMPARTFSAVRSDDNLPKDLFSDPDMNLERSKDSYIDPATGKQRLSDDGFQGPFQSDTSGNNSRYSDLFIGFTRTETLVLFAILFGLIVAVFAMGVKLYKLRKNGHKWSALTTFPTSRNASLGQSRAVETYEFFEVPKPRLPENDNNDILSGDESLNNLSEQVYFDDGDHDMVDYSTNDNPDSLYLNQHSINFPSSSNNSSQSRSASD